MFQKSLRFTVLVVVLAGLITIGLNPTVLFLEGFNQSDNNQPPQALVHQRDSFFGLAHPTSDVLWLVGTEGKVLKTKNKGEKWTLQKTPVDVNLQDIAAFNEKKAIIVGDNNTVLMTESGGDSWVTVEEHPKSSQGGMLRKVVIDPKTQKAWVLGPSGFVMISQNQGKNWREILKNNHRTMNDATFPGDRVVLAGEYGNYLVGKSVGEGSSYDWKKGKVEVRQSIYGVDFRNSKTWMMVGLEGLVFRTIDGGSSWQSLSTGTSASLYDVKWIQEHNKWVATGGLGILLRWAPNQQTISVKKLDPTEGAWHREIAYGSGSYYLTGRNVGSWKQGEWTTFLQEEAQE